MVQSTLASFRRLVWAHYRKYGRHNLPWRNLPAGRQGRRDPYKILVSEVMLQQTQVERVVLYYKRFLKEFPSAKALASAPLQDVLRVWQGLGYNRRAQMLHAAAQTIAKEGMPHTPTTLEALPGVGRYTARAVAALAFNQNVVLLETNIRTAVIHHFFKKGRVSDAKIETILLALLPKEKGREWNLALMDYGAHLKRTGVRLNARSAHYVAQERFAGSMREARGAILRAFLGGERREKVLVDLLGPRRRTQMRRAIMALRTEGLVH